MCRSFIWSRWARWDDLGQHDIKFEEDNGESLTLGARVAGDVGLEITQFTYFQQCGGVDLFPISAELTYGLERIAAFLQDVDSIYDIVWARDLQSGHVRKYGDVRLADELQMSVYNFEAADVASAWKHFDLCEAEAKALLDGYAELCRNKAPAAEMKRFPLLGAYELCLKCSHLFNIWTRVAILCRHVGVSRRYGRNRWESRNR
jgi:glycyl-tRNA synthetase alpha chain